MKKISVLLLLLFIASYQLGCNSSGSSVSSETVSQFTSWSSISYPSEVSASGVAYEGNYTYNTSTGAINSIGGASEASSPTATLTYNSSGTLTKAVVSTSSQTQTYNTFTSANANGTLSFGGKTSEPSDWSLGVEPLHPNVNWKYQTIAVWTDPDNGSGKYGSMSVGSRTPGSSIPSGSATFTGFAGGFYSDASNNVHVVQSDFSANANFGSRSIAVSTTNSIKQQYDGNTGSFGSVQNDANLNFTGTLSYSPNQNSLSGTLTTTSGMSGPSSSKLYGPNAEEIGGAFNLTGGSQTFVGAFGAKQ